MLRACACKCECTCAKGHMERSEDNFRELVLTIRHHVSPGDRTQVFRLGPGILTQRFVLPAHKFPYCWLLEWVVLMWCHMSKHGTTPRHIPWHHMVIFRCITWKFMGRNLRGWNRQLQFGKTKAWSRERYILSPARTSQCENTTGHC